MTTDKNDYCLMNEKINLSKESSLFIDKYNVHLSLSVVNIGDL